MKLRKLLNINFFDYMIDLSGILFLVFCMKVILYYSDGRSIRVTSLEAFIYVLCFFVIWMIRGLKDYLKNARLSLKMLPIILYAGMFFVMIIVHENSSPVLFYLESWILIPMLGAVWLVSNWMKTLNAKFLSKT